MRRRDFFGKLLGVMGVAAFPVISSSSETVSGDICSCGFLQAKTKALETLDSFSTVNTKCVLGTGGDLFFLTHWISCGHCGAAMFMEGQGDSIGYTCFNAGRIEYGVWNDGNPHREVSTPACPRFGIKYRAPKVRMERVP